MVVTLTDLDTERAIETARRAIEYAEKNNFRDFTIPIDKLQAHVVGICGEIALAKFLQLPWNGFELATRKMGDVSNIEVRTTTYQFGNLIVRPRDLDDRKYVLVRANKHPAYEIVGWIWGHEAKKPEWEREKNHEISSYFLVPSRLLRTMETFSIDENSEEKKE